VTEQVAGNFQARDPHLAKYLEKVQALASRSKEFNLVHVPREQNSGADLLSKIMKYKNIGQS